MQEEGLLSRLERIQEELSKVVIIKKRQLDNNIVNLDDGVIIEIKYADDEREEIEVVLDDSSHDEKAISLNSPLGKVLYKAEIGKTYEYIINDSIVNKVTIKKKL